MLRGFLCVIFCTAEIIVVHATLAIDSLVSWYTLQHFEKYICPVYHHGSGEMIATSM